MRLHLPAGARPVALVMLCGLLAAGPAAAVTLSCGTGNGLAGQTVNVAISASDLTGLGVVSYEFRVSYNANVLTAVGTDTTGTLTGAARWGAPTLAVTSGQATVTVAGAAVLSGAGPLVRLSFLVNPAQLTGTSTTLALSNALLDEGQPRDTTTNGSFTVIATPVLTVSPNSAEIVRDSVLAFSAGGTVTPPVSWSTTDPSVATIGPSGQLTGIAPGRVRVVAVDAASRRDTTNGDIVVRGMGVRIGGATVALGQAFSVPVTTTRLDGLGVRAGEIKVSFDNTHLSFASASAPPGTLLHGYGGLSAGSSALGTTTTLTILVGGVDLAGSGALFDLDLVADSVHAGTTTLQLVSALFNEDLPAWLANGSVAVHAPSSFTVLPATVALLTGQQQAFTLGGSYVPPVTWSTLDPAVATIDSTGRLTAVAGGMTRVQAVDATLGRALNTAVNVYDFGLSAGSVTATPGSTVHVPLQSDRDLGPLGVVAVELAISWSPTWVTSVQPAMGGAILRWGTPSVTLGTGTARIVAAGGAPLAGPVTGVTGLDLTIAPSTPVPTDIPVTIASALFNEGHPLPLLTNGIVHVRSAADVPPADELGLRLEPPTPNPARGTVRLAFTVPVPTAGGGRTRLLVLGVDGRRVRTLLDGPLAPGAHERAWDLLDEAGRPVRAGLYLVRLETPAGARERKLVTLR